LSETAAPVPEKIGEPEDEASVIDPAEVGLSCVLSRPVQIADQ
jgi:hypothetical protein